MLVLDTERLDFEANYAGEISFNVSVIQYSEPQVVVQGKRAIILHTSMNALALGVLQLRHLSQRNSCQPLHGQLEILARIVLHQSRCHP